MKQFALLLLGVAAAHAVVFFIMVGVVYGFAA